MRLTLHTEAVPPALLDVLRHLASTPELEDFHLVGGTALALRLGHRQSVDIDLFCTRPFDAGGLLETLVAGCGLTGGETARNTVRGLVRGVKVECLAHQYPLLREPEHADGFRIACLDDLAAFKANALANRGAKKDFWDLHALLAQVELRTVLEWHRRKYASANSWGVERSLTYFDDADAQPDPLDLRGVTWEQVKQDIAQHVRRLRP